MVIGMLFDACGRHQREKREKKTILFLIILFSVCTRVSQTSGVPHGASHTDDQQESQDAKENISYPHDNNEVVGEV